jgi:predicted flap endonuclease-1-like 5' DNA nuclease
MPFSANERTALLALKGVGNTIITRLEQMGFESLKQLASANSQEVLAIGAQITHSSCWKNSPQARSAIESAIQLAKTHT